MMSRHVPPILRPPDPYLMTTTSTFEPERREALSSPSPPSQSTKSSQAFLSPPATPTTPTPQTHSPAVESLLLVTRDGVEGQDREGLQHVTSTDHTIEEPVIAPPTLSTKSPTVEKTPVTSRPSSQGDEMNGPTFSQNSAQKRSIDDPKLDPILEQPRLAHVQYEAFDEHATESAPIPTGPHHAILAPALNLVPAISESMHNKEYDSSLRSERSERDNGSTFSIREEYDETDGQDSEFVAVSMISPAKHSKPPPVSSSLASSAPKKSSMILHPGTLSPAWSLNSIPRDISATYKLLFPTLEPGLDEKLFGLVDR